MLCASENVFLDHCVQLTGWQDNYPTMIGNMDIWKVRNSWGPDWGENGYIYLERGSDVCGIADEATLPIV